MFVRRFGVKVSDDFAIAKWHVDVENGYGCEGMVACEFYGGVNVIEKGNRFNEHRRPVDNPSNISKPTTVSEHFLTNDHSANDITLIPLELTKSNRDSVRKAREAYLIERGKTLEPLGINKKDEM